MGSFCYNATTLLEILLGDYSTIYGRSVAKYRFCLDVSARRHGQSCTIDLHKLPRKRPSADAARRYLRHRWLSIHCRPRSSVRHGSMDHRVDETDHSRSAYSHNGKRWDLPIGEWCAARPGGDHCDSARSTRARRLHVDRRLG